MAPSKRAVWEYWVDTVPDQSEFQAKLTMAGLRGWELVSVLTRSEYWLLTYKRVK